VAKPFYPTFDSEEVRRIDQSNDGFCGIAKCYLGKDGAEDQDESVSQTKNG